MSISYCLILACLLPTLAHGLDLNEAVREAVTNNPSLTAARAQIDAAAGRAQQARLWPNPALELSAQDVPVNDGGLSRSKNMIGISQTIPFPGKIKLAGRAGNYEVRATEQQFRLAEVELVRDVKMAFARALVAEQRLAIGRQLIELAASSSAAAGKRLGAGSATAQEQLRAEVELERARANAQTEQRDRAIARQQLARLLGRRDLGETTVTGTLSDRVETNALPLARHPKVAAATAERDRTEAEWRRARLDAYPDVTVGVAGGYDGAVNESLTEFRVSLPLPLFDHGQAKRREARAKADAARAELSAVEQRLQEQIAVAGENLRAAAEQVAAYRDRIVPKAEEALRLVQGGFEAGKFGLFDLLDTQRSVAEARLGYLNKLLELDLARAEMEALAGTQPKE